MHRCIRICIKGELKMTIFSAERCASVTLSAVLLNLSFSNGARTNAFTTRMAIRFSCTLLFMSSYLRIIT